MIELDLRLYPKPPRIGQNFAESVSEGDPDGFENPDVTARLIEGFKPNAIYGRHKRGGAAVHNGGFRTVDLNRRVIDAQPGQCGQDVLGC